MITKVLTLREASDRYGIPIETLRTFLKRGAKGWKVNKDYRKSGPTWLITKEALERKFDIKERMMINMKIEKVEIGMAAKFIINNSDCLKSNDLTDMIETELISIDIGCAGEIEVNNSKFEVYRHELYLIDAENEEYLSFYDVEKIK